MKKGDLVKFNKDSSLVAVIVKGPYATVINRRHGKDSFLSEESIVVDIILEGVFYAKIKTGLLSKIDEQI